MAEYCKSGCITANYLTIRIPSVNKKCWLRIIDFTTNLILEIMYLTPTLADLIETVHSRDRINQSFVELFLRSSQLGILFLPMNGTNNCISISFKSYKVSALHSINHCCRGNRWILTLRSHIEQSIESLVPVPLIYKLLIAAPLK